MGERYNFFLKEHRDAQNHDLADIECLHNFHIIYLSYEKINVWNITVFKSKYIKLKREK